MTEYIIEKTKELIAAPSCCPEAKAAGQAYLDAAGTDKEAEAGKNLIAELEEDIIPIDGLLEFAASDHAAEIFGDGVEAFRAHAKELKASGAAYCDCPACAACEAILSRKDEI